MKKTKLATQLRRSLLSVALLAGVTSAAQAKEWTVDVMNGLDKVHDAQVSPDNRWMVYGHREYNDDWEVVNDDLFMVSVQNPAIKPKRLTSGAGGEYNVEWSKNGDSIYFLSSRSGSSQVWRLNLSGGESIQITDLPLAVEGFKLSPDNQGLALALTVTPSCETIACSVKAADKRAQLKKTQKEGYKVRAFDQLPLRHWNQWTTEEKSHLFYAAMPQGTQRVTDAKDLMPGWVTDAPAKPFSGMEEVAFSPDSKSIVFSAKAPSKDQMWTTNADLFQVSVEGGEIANLTDDNEALDILPKFSKDGRFMAYLAMQTPGYEADKLRIIIKDQKTGVVKELAPLWDRSVSDFAFADDNRAIYAIADDKGEKGIFEISMNFGDVRPLYKDGRASGLQVAGDRLVFGKDTFDHPREVYSIYRDGSEFTQLTRVNDEELSGIKFGEFGQFSFKGWNNEDVTGHWIKPANFEEGKKYPVALIIHGGPQSAFGNLFHTRWNSQLWAAQGYGVLLIDFHGTPGYGQAFTDSINKNWGSKPFEDVKKGFNAAVQQMPWLDGSRACALGASYGGYMVNWIAGAWNDQLKCLVNHAGLFDMKSFATTTEELWFPEHDFGGTGVDPNVDFDTYSPSNFVHQWKLPMLVTHGMKDYRVPYAQGIGAYTSLQRQSIPSRLVMFETEDHWIINKDNLKRWYGEVFSWMSRWTAEPKPIAPTADTSSN